MSGCTNNNDGKSNLDDEKVNQQIEADAELNINMEENDLKINSKEEREEKMDEQTKKMMAEGMAYEKNELSDNSSEEIIQINGTDISITCPDDLFYKQENVTYGELIHTSYYSTTCEKDRNVNVLLPANYDEGKQYPVFYYLHGFFGDENSMVGDDKSGSKYIFGNMMKDNLMEEAIIVYPSIYASKTKPQCTAFCAEDVEAYDNFVNDLVTDLMPFIENNYSVKTGRDNTAIAGFSMGGRESLAIGLYKPELFGYIGAIAPAPGLVHAKDWAMEHPGQFKEEDVKYESIKPKFLMICCGDTDKTVGTFPISYHELYSNNGIDHIFYEIPGSDHGDPAISSGVYNFSKQLFK